MKILSVTTALPQNDAECTRILNIAKLMEKNGIKIKLVHYIIKGSNNYEMFKKRSFKGTFLAHKPLTLMFKHLNVLRSEDYDLVYGNTFIATFFCILGKLMKKQLILDMHGISEESYFFGNSRILSFFVKIMEMITLLCSNKILCVSYEMVDHLHNKKRVPRNKLFYIPNGVDLDFFKQKNKNQVTALRKKYKLENKLIFGYLGGIHKWQGFENFIEASKEINNNKFASVIVGCNISQYKQKDNITYIPRVSKNEIVDYYSLCDILVLPRPKHIVTEVAAPTKFAEYTSMSKPILTTDVGDAAKFVKKYENGLVVENNDLENLKNGINQFLIMDRDKITQMAQNSRKLAENEFDWNRISIDLNKILRN